MAEEKIEVSIDGLSRLQSAARDFARAEIDHIVRAVIGELRSRPAEGVFGDVHAPHLWDEYCWGLQEGPFDDPTIIDDTNCGSISDAFDGLLQANILAEVEKLPKHGQIFLSTFAFEEDVDSDEEECLGCIWIDGIVKVVTEAVNERASRRNLDLIGPHRADAIRYEIEGTGFVWSVLDRNVAMDLVSGHVDTMIDPDADLSPLAAEMVEAFLTAAREDEDRAVLLEFLKHFEEKIRSVIIENDILVSLEDMRGKLLKAWDK
jgi:hypothetical protein